MVEFSSHIVVEILLTGRVMFKACKQGINIILYIYSSHAKGMYDFLYSQIVQ